MSHFLNFVNHLLPTPGTSNWFLLIDATSFAMDHFFLVCMSLYAVLLFFQLLRKLAALPSKDKAENRMALFKRTITRFGVTYVALAIVFAVAGYCIDAMDRSGARDCERNISPDYKSFYVDVCAVRSDRHGRRSLIRLYAAGNGELLAEEFVSNAEGKLTWEKTKMRDSPNIDGTYVFEPSSPYVRQWGDNSVEIQLPPPWWQRLTAKLP